MINSNDKDAISKLKMKVEKLTKNQEHMKACNKIIKDKKDKKVDRLIEILKISSLEATELMKPDFCGRVGFPSFQLTSNNASIKATQARITQLEKAAQFKTEESIIGGVKVVKNAELMRIQFFFDGKPEHEVISLMKKHGFKWSPSNVCWQRLWNDNALVAIRYYIEPELIKINNNSSNSN